jgi:hypothetical protein
MRNIASRSFKIALYALIVAAAGLTLALELARPGADRLPLLNFELGLFKAILAGFVVGMLGILIPAVASEARQRFEQRKESRIAYSKAKTEIDYLKLRLAASRLAEAAAALQGAYGFDEAVAQYASLRRTYERLGYRLGELPKIAVAARAQFVIDRVPRR